MDRGRHAVADALQACLAVGDETWSIFDWLRRLPGARRLLRARRLYADMRLCVPGRSVLYVGSVSPDRLLRRIHGMGTIHGVDAGGRCGLRVMARRKSR